MNELADQSLDADESADSHPDKDRAARKVVIASVFATFGLGLLGCAGSDSAPSTAPSAAVDDTDRLSSVSNEDDGQDTADGDDADDSVGAEDDSSNDSSGNESEADGSDTDAPAPDGDDTSPETEPDAETHAEASAATTDSTIDIDPSIPEDLIVVTAPPTTAAALPESDDGVVFERIDPSPELPGMTRRPIRDAFPDPNDDQIIVVRFGGLICDGFRTLVEETEDSVAISVEGATTLGENEGACDPQLYATELAAVLSKPLGSRTLTALSE